MISLLSDSISEKIEFIELSDVELEHEEYSQLEELQEKTTSIYKDYIKINGEIYFSEGISEKIYTVLLTI